jgi:protein-disulfide isomerase
MFVILLAAMAWCGCERSVPQSVPVAPALPVSDVSLEEVVAVVDGNQITAGALDTTASGQLRKLQAQIYQVRRKALDDMIDTMLIEKAAKEQGMSPEAYLAEQVDAKIEQPTDEQIQAFYDQQKARIRAPLEQVKDRVVQYLTQNSKNEAKKVLTARLRKKADVKIVLEPPRVELSLEDPAYTLGEKDAPIVLVEFSDFQCPYSKRAQASLSQVLDEYKGKIRYAFFDFPLPFHKEAMKAHQAVRCAEEQEKGFPYSRKVFDNQKKLSVEDLKGYAAELDLDKKKFDACLDSARFTASVQHSIERGKSVGVTGTPAFFVNGIMISGAQPFEAFQTVVDQELANGG